MDVANFISDVIMSDPGERMKISGVIALESSKITSSLVLGGSMTCGHMDDRRCCGQPKGGVVRFDASACDREVRVEPAILKSCGFGSNSDCKPCAFPARLERWLQGAYPDVRAGAGLLGARRGRPSNRSTCAF